MALAGAGCRGIEELPDEILLAILACKPSSNPTEVVFIELSRSLSSCAIQERS